MQRTVQREERSERSEGSVAAVVPQPEPEKVGYGSLRWLIGSWKWTKFHQMSQDDQDVYLGELPHKTELYWL